MFPRLAIVSLICFCLCLIFWAGFSEAQTVVLDGKQECQQLHRGVFGTPEELVDVVLRNCTAVKAQNFIIHGSLTLEPSTRQIVLQRGFVDGHGQREVCLEMSEITASKIQNNTFQNCNTMMNAGCSTGVCSNIAFFNTFNGTPGLGQVSVRVDCRKEDWNSNIHQGVDVGYILYYPSHICEVANNQFFGDMIPFVYEDVNGGLVEGLTGICGVSIGNNKQNGVLIPGISTGSCIP